MRGTSERVCTIYSTSTQAYQELMHVGGTCQAPRSINNVTVYLRIYVC